MRVLVFVAALLAALPAAAQEAPSPPTADETAPPQRSAFSLEDVASIMSAERGRMRRERTIEEEIAHVSSRHMARCWRAPTDLPNPERLDVTVEISLNRDGTLNGSPRVTRPRNYTFDPAMRTAVQRALAAIDLCAPFPFASDPRLAEHYDAWDQMEFRFSAPP